MYKLAEYLAAVEDLARVQNRIKTLEAQRNSIERALDILEQGRVPACITAPLVKEITRLNGALFDLQILAHSKSIDLLVHEKQMNDAE